MVTQLAQSTAKGVRGGKAIHSKNEALTRVRRKASTQPLRLRYHQEVPRCLEREAPIKAESGGVLFYPNRVDVSRKGGDSQSLNFPTLRKPDQLDFLSSSIL